jgi:hypothetical protein
VKTRFLKKCKKTFSLYRYGEGFTTTPEVTWDDVGSLTEVREVGGLYKLNP